MSTLRRNDPCPCGSGRKYKHCCLARTPGQAEAAYNRGVAAAARGEAEQALRCFSQALEIDPGFAEAHNNLGMILLSQGRPRDAAQAFERALASRPEYTTALYNLAGVQLRLGELQQAVASYEALLARAPDDAQALHNLGKASLRLGRPDAAAAALERAVALRPDHPEAYVDLANARLNQGRADDAAACCRQALGLRPDYAEAHLTLGIACCRLGRLEESAACCRQAIALKPDDAEAYVNLANSYQRPGGLDQAVENLRRALALSPGFAAAHSALLVTLQYAGGCAPAESFAESQRFAARFEAPLKPSWRPHTNTKDPARRLKIGYLSPDFRRHSVASFIEPVLARHDRAQVEVYGYYSHHRQDDMTARLAALTDHWRPCRELSDDQLAELMRADGIDILVDLAGHTNENRLLALARRPAPVQVTYLGYPATTGLAAVDYRLCTHDTDPPGQEAWHSESLYRLPRTLWCYRPPAEWSAERPPVRAGRPGAITFASLNNPAKISPERIGLWAEILRAVPGSRLLMTNTSEESVRPALHGPLAAHGIAAERVACHGRLPAPRYRQLLAEIDIALDPYPYNGTTTTCETLWAGIPVVTQRGETSAARSGFALLKAVGLEELAAEDEGDYARIAVALAGDAGRLQALRRELPARFAASPLRDEAALARDLEDAYRDMWRRWCRTGSEPR
jgi:predicted O-linked N-acetylglucosamine transferase (SPINDLY family)